MTTNNKNPAYGVSFSVQASVKNNNQKKSDKTI